MMQSRKIFKDYYEFLFGDHKQWFLSGTMPNTVISQLEDAKVFKRKNGPLVFWHEYRNYLEFLDKINASPSPYSHEIQIKFTKLTDRFLTIANLFEQNIVEKEIVKFRRSFIECIRDFLNKSKYINRALNKPRGYPGDYLVFENLYDGLITSKGIGRYFDIFALNDLLSQSIINRKNKMKDLIKKNIDGLNKKLITILNVGCGSCREVEELLNEHNFINKKICFDFIDQDTEAIKFAKRKLGKFSKERQFTFFQTSALQLFGFGDRGGLVLNKKYDMIYSIGVVDYFLDNVLEKFIAYYSSHLNRGGTLIFAICSNIENRTYAPMVWFYDWYIYLRNPQDAIGIANTTFSLSNICIVWEKNRQIFFVNCRKK